MIYIKIALIKNHCFSNSSTQTDKTKNIQFSRIERGNWEFAYFLFQVRLILAEVFFSLSISNNNNNYNNNNNKTQEPPSPPKEFESNKLSSNSILLFQSNPN
jgi:hypothetical protein